MPKNRVDLDVLATVDAFEPEPLPDPPPPLLCHYPAYQGP